MVFSDFRLPGPCQILSHATFTKHRKISVRNYSTQKIFNTQNNHEDYFVNQPKIICNKRYKILFRIAILMFLWKTSQTSRPPSKTLFALSLSLYSSPFRSFHSFFCHIGGHLGDYLISDHRFLYSLNQYKKKHHRNLYFAQDTGLRYGPAERYYSL